jgi:hypothetical protein
MPASEYAVSLSRVVAITSIHSSSLDTFLAPCSARKPRSASSSRVAAVAAVMPASGASGRVPSAQSTAWVR